MSQPYNAAQYSTAKYGSSAALPADFNAFFRYNDAVYNSFQYNGLGLNAAIIFGEDVSLAVLINKNDTLTLEDVATTEIEKGPQDTVRVGEWVRIERTPPVIPWEN